jgi:hypothetical protein
VRDVIEWLNPSSADYLIVKVLGVIAVIQAHRIADLTARCNAHRSLISQLQKKLEETGN